MHLRRLGAQAWQLALKSNHRISRFRCSRQRNPVYCSGHLGPLAINRGELRQARKGATVTSILCAGMRLRWSSFTPCSPRDDLRILLRQLGWCARCLPWLTSIILKAIPTPDHSIKGAVTEGLTSLDRVFRCFFVPGFAFWVFDARLA